MSDESTAAIAALLSAGQASPEDLVLVDRLDVLKEKLLDAAEECWAKLEPQPSRAVAAWETDAAARKDLDKAITERDSARRREAVLLEEVTSVRSRLNACKGDLHEVNQSTSKKMESLLAENASLREKIDKTEENRTVVMGLLVFFFFYFEFDILAWCLLVALIYEKIVKTRIMRSRRRRRADEQKRDLEAGTSCSSLQP